MVKKGLSFLKASSSNEKALANDARFIDAIALKNAGDYEKAIAILEDILKANGDNAPVYFELSKINAQKNETEKSLDYINHAVELNPKNKWYVNYKISLTKQLGLYSDCEKTFLVRQKIFPNNTDYDIEFSDFYITFKKYFKALKLYDKVEKKIGVSHDINFNKFLIYKGLEEYEKSENEIKKLIEVFPGNMSYYIDYADFKLDYGQVAEAIDIYNQALLVKPNDPSILNEKAQYYMLNHQREKAFELYKIILKDPSFKISEKKHILLKFGRLSESDPTFLPLTKDLSLLAAETHPYDFSINMFTADFMYDEGNFKEAINYYLKTIDLKPNNYNAWIQLILSYQSTSNYGEMISKCEEAIGLFPTQPLFYFYGGMALIQENNFEKAIEMLEEGNDLVVEADKKMKAQFLSALGDAFHALKKHSKSDEYFELSLEIESDNFYVLNNYAYYLSERNVRLEKAKLMSKKSNDLHPNEASFQDTFGWILYQLGDYEKALNWLKKAEKNGGMDSGVINEHIGDVFQKIGNLDLARKYWKRAHEIGGASEQLDKKLKL
jgi:tetratricopeptide (TPR) repeat protein